ncbi:methyl-accepting chemotaxis protein [Vibrio vulnificus]|uniref:methyl-accepting chemotaxis protein n=2 Tax=Vibrio vulnificus TaxID=672 RepID=UPI0012AD20A3|nr:methyl-accepting chemotaxis protein [Vibrio vulnificus]EGQ7696742.1 methyl-accepting chemotaxis protein [Vibrio vulnificus]EGQ7954035.1 methyl-accepting chemotaxis protein [Vibrio vulnificus]EGQ7985017.1 methyl-accepting chemotaxis protein [Vibrio vulnificus]EGQ8173515.1 methyl-accepting chemotaxis protein [Vibrio vulnificus]EGQ9235982.1 methyl-accepting chemotaxis protein [Vibrio vulnificus]
MKIQHKLTIPVGIILLTFLVVSFINYSLSEKQAKIADDINNGMYPVVMSLEDAYRDLYQASNAAQGLLLSTSEEEWAYHTEEFEFNGYKAIPRIKKVQTLIDSQLIPSEMQRELDRLVNLTQSWISLYEPIFKRPELAAAYYAENQQKIHDEFVLMRTQLKTISNAIDETLLALNQQYVERQNFVDNVILIGLVAVVISVSFAYWVIQRFVMKPMRQIQVAMRDIAEGEGDLSRRINISSRDELGELAHSFNQFTSRIHNTIGEVVAATQSVRSDMHLILQSTQQISQFSHGQQQESHTVAAAVNEMQATSQSVSDSAGEAAHSSSLASEQVEQAQRTVQQTVESIEHLSDEIESATQVIHRLDSQVSNIASVLDVIRGIADQTNLLALNAAIEAARAGEQGRGFAVVADEVRSLASRTSDSTGEIQAMIERLQQGAQEAVAVMSRSVSSREETLHRASNATDSLGQIGASIVHMNDMNSQIASAATQQSAVSADINLNVQNIADSSKQMVSMVAQVQQACEGLDEQCEQLDTLLGRFKI